MPEKLTEKEYVAEFKKNYPIYDCLGSTGGRWKWRKYLDGIDLRYGYHSKKAAEMARAKCAKGAYAMYSYENEVIACPKCGKETTREIIDKLGECLECAEKRHD